MNLSMETFLAGKCVQLFFIKINTINNNRIYTGYVYEWQMIGRVRNVVN